MRLRRFWRREAGVDGEDEDGAEAFAAGFEGVAHGGVEARGGSVGGWDEAVEGGLGASDQDV